MSATPTLVFIFGPPAVGKMTVGLELAERTGLRLFHNHHSIELALQFFDFGTPGFSRLVREFRRLVFEEVAGSELPGLIFTYVWAFDQATEAPNVRGLTAIFSERGGRVLYVELEATLEERLRRNETELRLASKPSKRDVGASRSLLLRHDRDHQLNSKDEFAGRADYLRIDNTALSPEEVAEAIIRHFGLARIDPVPAPPAEA